MAGGDLSVKETFYGKVAFWLILLIIAGTTLFYGTVHQPVIALFYVVVGLLVLLWTIDSFASGYLRLDDSFVELPLLLAGAYGILQIIPFGSFSAGGLDGIPNTISTDPHSTQLAALHFFVLAAFLGVTLVLVDSSKRLRSLMSFVLIFGSIYAFYAILQLVLSPGKIYGIYSSPFANPIGSFVNRHNFAAFMEMSILLPAGLLIASAVKPDRRLLYFTGIGLMGIALLLSGSRGGLVSLVAGVSFLLVLSNRFEGNSSPLIRFAGIGLILAVIGVGAYFISAESTTFQRISETAQTEDVTTDRTQIWQGTLRIAKSGLPFGVGLGAFGVNYSRFDSSNGLERVEQAHNDYLELIAAAGIPGILIGIAFIFLVFRAGFRASRARDRYIRGAGAGALAGIFAILVHSLFDFVLHTTAIAILFLVLTAVVTVSARMASIEPKKRKRKKKPENVTPINAEADPVPQN